MSVMENARFRITGRSLGPELTNKDLVRLIKREYRDQRNMTVRYLFKNVFSIDHCEIDPFGNETHKILYYCIVGMMLGTREILACKLDPILGKYVYLKNGPNKKTTYPLWPWEHKAENVFKVTSSERLYNLETGKPLTKSEEAKLRMLVSIQKE